MKTFNFKTLLAIQICIVICCIFTVSVGQQQNTFTKDGSRIDGISSYGIIEGQTFPATFRLPPKPTVTPVPSPAPPFPDPIPVPQPSHTDSTPPQPLPRPSSDGISAARSQNSSVAGEFRIYPNPTNGKFSVQYYSGTPGNMIIKLIDITGKEILNQRIEGVDGFYQNDIDLTNHDKGIYMLWLQVNEKQTMKKIIVT